MKAICKTLGAAILAGTCLSAPAHAGNFYAFGDSLVDNGNTPKFGIDYPPPPYSDYRFSNGPVWAQYFPGLTGLGFVPSNDYAVGGAFAGPLTVLGTTYNNLENLPPALGEPGFPVALPSFLQQVGEFQAGGGRLGASDVVGVWVGANDYFATLALVEAGYADATTAITDAVQTVALQTTEGVNELVNLGGRRFIVFNLPALGDTPLFNQDGAATVAEADAISTAHNSTLAQFMAGEHDSTGANIIVMNEAQIFNELLADPAAYGKTNTTDACIDTPSCVTAPTAVQNQYVFWDTVHPTTGTHLLIAEYAADALNGLAGLAVPAQVEAFGADAFATQLDQRLDALRAGASGFSFNLPDQGMQGSVGSGDSKLSGFFSGAYDFGSRDTLGADSGFSYSLGSFAAGLDDRLAPGVAAGVAVGYATEHANVTEDGTVSANAYQFGAYASFYQPNYYLNIDFAYGIDSFTDARPGVVGGNINSKPSGESTQFGGETGYVFHAGALAFGPVAGIDATNAGLHAYSETGDPALTQSVDSQNFEQVVGDVGATASAELSAGRLALAPHLTITADRRFTGDGGSFSSVFTDEPGVGLTTTYPDIANTWAEISGGVAARLSRNLSLSADFASSIAKTGGADHEVSGSLHLSF